MVLNRIETKRIILPSVVAFVVVPIAFTAYSLMLGGSTGAGGYSVNASRIQIILALLALGELGVVGVVSWRWQLRLTSLIGGTLLLTLPALFGIIPGESKSATGYLLLALVAISFVAGLEAAIRYSESLGHLLRSNIGLYGITLGIFHVLLAIGLEVIVRGTSAIYPLTLIAGLVCVCILFVTTVSAAMLWARGELYSPTILLLLWFIIGVYETVTIWLNRGSLTASSGIDWSGFNPAPDYVFSAGVLLALFLFVVVTELIIKSALEYTQRRSSPVE